MIRLGHNIKITVGASRRAAVRAFADALGAKLVSPSDSMDAAALDGDTRIGFAYVPDDQALTEAQLRLAPWLEIVVDDVGGVVDRLTAQGLARVEYPDREHAYFTGPGGWVFRIAAAKA